MTGGRRRAAAFALAFGILVAACGNDDDPALAPIPGAGAGGGEESPVDGGDAPSEVTVTADDIAFGTDRIDVDAGEEVTVSFENLDDGVPHNLHVQAGEVDVETDIATGPDTQELRFTVSEAGDYTFICDVHPQQMTGDLVVS